MELANVTPLAYLPRGAPQTFTYLVPETFRLAPAALVTIPFRGRKIIGLVTSTERTATAPSFAVRNVTAPLPRYRLTATQLPLMATLERHYGASRTLALKTVIPALLRRPRDGEPELSPKTFREPPPLPRPRRAILERLLREPRYLTLTGRLYRPDDPLFLAYVARRLGAGGQVLILLPDRYSLATAAATYRRHFPVIEWHRELTVGAMSRAWLHVQEGTARVILGTRSAVFAPFEQLTAILLFDEPDDSYKSWDQMPYYDARRLARTIGDTIKIPLLTTRLLPPLLPLDTGRYLNLAPQNRVAVTVVDRTHVQHAERGALIADPILEAIGSAPPDGRVLLFLNRLGDAGFACRDCGELARCRRCEAPLMARTGRGRSADRLRCDRCGEAHRLVTECPRCHGVRIRSWGLGVERAAVYLRGRFPGRRLQRLDADAIRTPAALVAALASIAAGRVDLTVATPMVLSRLWSLPGFHTVAVLRAELLLVAPDWRTSERAMAALQQLRAAATARYLVETSTPEHPIFRSLRSGQLEPFFAREAADRERLAYPPYVGLLKLTAAAGTARGAADRLAAELTRHDRRLVVSRTTAPHGQVRLIVKTPTRYPLERLWELVPAGWKIDVDPLTLT